MDSKKTERQKALSTCQDWPVPLPDLDRRWKEQVLSKDLIFSAETRRQVMCAVPSWAWVDYRRNENKDRKGWSYYSYNDTVIVL